MAPVYDHKMFVRVEVLKHNGVQAELRQNAGEARLTLRYPLRNTLGANP